jgi:TRAP-type C4-dicarboxylate transport system substrate-binding protein
MYLTSILIAKDFWNNLSTEDQEAVQAAALHSSRLERQWSVDDSDKLAADETAQRELGMVYREFDESERAKLKSSTEKIYDKYKDFFTTDLVDGIIKS